MLLLMKESCINLLTLTKICMIVLFFVSSCVVSFVLFLLFCFVFFCCFLLLLYFSLCLFYLSVYVYACIYNYLSIFVKCWFIWKHAPDFDIRNQCYSYVIINRFTPPKTTKIVPSYFFFWSFLLSFFDMIDGFESAL